jgi:hypothetical protein
VIARPLFGPLVVRWPVLFVVVASFLPIGCGSALPRFAPINGSITQGGKPVVEAKVILHSQGERPENLPLPIAITDEFGRFSVTTLSNNDGALAGTYTLTVELRALRRAGEEMVRDGKHLLPHRYADSATSGLVQVVKPDANQWDPIDLPLQ